jgi:arabinofuranosyltransferase
VSAPSPRASSVALLLTLVFLAVLLRTAWLSDDALITLRTVMNVTHGYGLTFNVAERVQTFTHPLWMFLLTGASLVTGNVYVATFALSIGVSLLVFWRVLRGAATPAQAWLALVLLLFSRAFVDFSTSGLENPLSNLLLVAFAGVALRGAADGRPRLTTLWLLASLLYLTRPDDVLFAAPILLAATWRAGRWTTALRAAAVGLLPAIAWTAFALVYYGFPFPNTAYAKLATGIPRGEQWRQGALYLFDSIDRDPLTLVAIAFAVLAGLAARGVARGLALGVLLYLVYIVSIGGDFMAGRFLATPFLVAVLLLTRVMPMEPPRAWVATGVLAAVGLASAQVPLLSDSRFDASATKPSGLVDERAIYFREHSLMLAERGSFRQPEWPPAGGLPPVMDVLDTCGLMGGAGLGWGPLTHLLDECALADPLLARLPAVFNHDWHPGHFRRMIPEGYRESLERKTNALVRPALRRGYEDLRLATRSRDLLSLERLAAIWRLNTGASFRDIDRAYYRHAGAIVALPDLAVETPDGTPAASARSLDDAALAVSVEPRPGRRHLDVALDSDDEYLLFFLRDNRIVSTMPLGPVPEYRRQPGLASYTGNLPPSATAEGFDTIVVTTVAGERFAVGHLLLDGYAPTDALLARRVYLRDMRDAR